MIIIVEDSLQVSIKIKLVSLCYMILYDMLYLMIKLRDKL